MDHRSISSSPPNSNHASNPDQSKCRWRRNDHIVDVVDGKVIGTSRSVNFDLRDLVQRTRISTRGDQFHPLRLCELGSVGEHSHSIAVSFDLHQSVAPNCRDLKAVQ